MENRPTLDPKRALSWSSISSFEWNRDQWWRKYIGKEIPEITPELEFGKMVDERIQSDRDYLPHVKRYSILQHKMECMFHEIPLIGIADSYEPASAEAILNNGGTKPKVRSITGAALDDYKTGRRPWDQKRADETGQLTMYGFLLWQIDKIRPEDVDFGIVWLPTHIKDGKIAFIEEDHTKLKPKVFRTRRTMRDVLEFGQKIQDIYVEMLEYCKHRPILDTSDWSQW